MRQIKKIMGTAGISYLLSICLAGGLVKAAEDTKSVGIGPVTEVKLDPLDTALATKGKEVFVSKCSACHKMEERYVGPAIKGITTRRHPAWIMNMIMNPQEMTQKDPTAQALLEEFLIPMTYQNVSQDETRSILEYFRHYDEKGEIAAAGGGAAGSTDKAAKGTAKGTKKK